MVSFRFLLRSLPIQWGSGRMAAIYFIAGIGGNLLSCLAAPMSIGVGASGALFGILGGELMWLIINWHLVRLTLFQNALL